MSASLRIEVTTDDYRRIHHALMMSLRNQDVPQYRADYLDLINRLETQTEAQRLKPDTEVPND